MAPRRFLPQLLLLGVLPFLGWSPPQEARKAVAVLRFDNNTGDARYDHLGRALAAMMISDLSVVEEIRLVERERLEDLQKELEFQESAHVDPATAQSMGMMVGAEYVVTGAFTAMDPEMRLDTRVDRVETSEIVKTANVRGKKDEFLDLQQRLADELVEGLGVVLTAEDTQRLRAQQEANRIDDVATVLAFSVALCLVDNGDYVDAFEQIRKVRDAAPGSAIVQLTFDHLKDRAEQDAKDEVKDRAGRAIGGLLGRRRAPEPSRVRGVC
jgi:TolB-like protein